MTRRRPIAVLTPELLGCDLPSAETPPPRSEFVEAIHEAIPWLVGEELSQLRTCLHEVWAVQQAGESLDCEAVLDLLALLRRAGRRLVSGVLSKELLRRFLRYGNTLAQVDALLTKMQGREDGPTPDEVNELDGLLAGPREQLARLQQQEFQPAVRTQTRVRIRREDE